MQQDILFNIQAISTNDEPIYLQGGRRLSKDEAVSLRIPDLIIPDSTYSEIFKSEFLSIRKSIGTSCNRYIVFGNLNQRDVKGRRIAFSCFLQSETDSIKAILSEINTCLFAVNYSIDIPDVNGLSSRKNTSCCNNKSLFYLIASIAAGLTVGYLVYQSLKNNINESNYEQQQTNQTVESDSVR